MYPVLLKIGPLTLSAYGTFVALGFFAGILLSIRLGTKEGLSRDTILDIGFNSFVAAIIGSRLLYVIVEHKHFVNNPLDIVKIWEGGVVFFGGFLMVIAVQFYYFRKHSLPLWKTMDSFAAPLALGHAIGRTGCFFAGCCYGKPTDLPWGVTFTHPLSMATKGIPIHPTQLYESGSVLLIFLLLLKLRKNKSFDGQLIWTYVLLYSAVRFTIEFFRADDRGFIFNYVSVSQAISIVLFISAVSFLVSKRPRRS
ncbi:MAG TPA: prolipoprotein diacylglyceryl transferase [Nitrospirae bacterium]|nr:prolipoprotein diacylglyceryl transferase [Nitrospirota bacterium]